MKSKAKSFCRNCPALCSVEIEIDNNSIIAITGDRSSPVTKGYFCVKADASRERQNGIGQIASSLKRGNGGHHRIATQEAIGEIAEKISGLIARYGPRSVGVYYGTGAFYSATAMSFTTSWAKSIGTPQVYSSQTIDQSPKVVRALRMGNFRSGKQPFANSDVWLLSGSNPLVSHIGAFTKHGPGIDIRAAKQRGLKLIVIDPRRTETARLATSYSLKLVDRTLSFIPGSLGISSTQSPGARSIFVSRAVISMFNSARAGSGLATATDPSRHRR